MDHPVLLFRNVAITTEYPNFSLILNEYGDKERMSRRHICNRLGIGETQGNRIFHDLRLAKMLDAKDAIQPLGRTWVSDVRKCGRPSPATLREAALHVPLFREAY